MSESARIRVLIVDDEPLARERIRDLLATDPQIDIVGECSNGSEAISSVRKLAPDLLAQWRLARFKEAAPTRHSLDHTQAFEFGISFGDGIAVQPKLFRKWTNRLKCIAGAQCARG